MRITNTLIQAVGLLLSLSITTEARSVSPVAKGYSRTEKCKPHPPFKPLPPSQLRTKTCHVATYGDGRDDSKHILSAIKKCNNGGKVVFDADKVYTIGTALDLTFLKHVDLGMSFDQCISSIDSC
jgi:galacturan 1,4-alpha-galacturonidase